MTQDEVVLLVRLAGLEKTLAAFPDDIAKAVAQAEALKAAFTAQEDAELEPTPPTWSGTGE